MITLLLKEIKEFFSSITGYLVVVIYLLINSMFMWIFKGSLNVFDMGMANIDTLFIISPWVFLFLVPAITMNMFAGEYKSGTMELLLTRPLTDFQIVFAKYLAAVCLVLIALIPTLFYLISINTLADPIGNVDFGAIAGSYIGLFFLAAGYTAIGIFASSLFKNSIISFLLSVLLCFIFFLGFDYLGILVSSGKVANFIISLGINDHYGSISRGVIDSRDVVYFLSVISIFIFAAKLRLESRKW
ncbi:MAG TPA: gliding motility-associated ABC transporter permease subunit GldF [Bacteroidales bacterium]|nr:gliding motility-associated ABC transporter permease subunit GldF [Bacteroidales bacterium]HPD24171.1 gliding motility-associated ABC transporter permease subunit GldF [Bacteroidales bacterium]HRT00158.1 gliding motility-associated ABC transporter permease subunit GldF [Bacteroidales bacterium]HRT80225.1 gliding motility-associated ABC transporter permease subunit GldF [Bacteroidales bacterium]